MTIAEMLRRIEAINLVEITGEAMDKNKDRLLDINRYQLYEKGVGKDNVSLPPYTPAYARKKAKIRGKSIVDIYVKGDLQKEMTLTVQGETYEISSKAEYTPYVVNKRPTIFGFTDEGKKEGWGVVLPDVRNEVKIKLFGI
jgi:hypothetical protein